MFENVPLFKDCEISKVYFNGEFKGYRRTDNIFDEV